MHQEEKILEVIVMVAEGRMRVVAYVWSIFIWYPQAKCTVNYNWLWILYMIFFCYTFQTFFFFYIHRMTRLSQRSESNKNWPSLGKMGILYKNWILYVLGGFLFVC